MRSRLLQAALVIICINASLACHGTLLVSGLRDDERRIILQEHNRLRQVVATGRYPGQPSAENMREMVWDDELAARAQQWANNCEFRHDPQRTINRFTMGQNLAIIWSTAPLSSRDGDFPSRIQSWFNEVSLYSFGDAWSPQTGHYSQLVWGETNLVGCGYSEYRDATKYNKLYVCNYGPGGNVVGYNPYQVGSPSCTKWGQSPSPRYQGLCSPAYTTAPAYTSNTIDTYEYTQSNNNNIQTSYSTSLFPQSSAPSIINPFPSTTPIPKRIPPPLSKKQAISLHIRPTTTASHHYGSQGSSTSRLQASSAGGSRPKDTLQTSQKGRIAANRPPAANSRKSIYEPVLRLDPASGSSSYYLYIPQEDVEGHQQQHQQKNKGPTSDRVETSFNKRVTITTTPKPINRGWSLLTWRG